MSLSAGAQPANHLHLYTRRANSPKEQHAKINRHPTMSTGTVEIREMPVWARFLWRRVDQPPPHWPHSPAIGIRRKLGETTPAVPSDSYDQKRTAGRYARNAYVVG